MQPPLLLWLLLALCLLPSCAQISLPVPSGPAPGPDAIAAPYTPGYQARATAPPHAKINLFGGDLENLQLAYPGSGPVLSVASINTSRSFGTVTSTFADAVRWAGMSKIASGFFATKSNEVTQAAKTARSKITSNAATEQTRLTTEAATRQAEIGSALSE